MAGFIPGAPSIGRIGAPRFMLSGVTALALAIPASAQTDPPAESSRDSQRWTWSSAIGEGRSVYVRNLNGPIHIEPSTTGKVEVEAIKRVGRRGRPEDVTITAVQRQGRGDVVICAIWNDRSRCDEDGYVTKADRGWPGLGSHRGNDVSVEFRVRLPRGARITATTVNGAVEADGVDAGIDARTVNGSIVARSSGGPVAARTTNGSLTIRTGLIGQESLDYSTVNGAVTLEVPRDVNADVELRTVNGGISTDFPLTVDGRFNSRRVRGSIGQGGPLIRLSTTNGSIYLKRR